MSQHLDVRLWSFWFLFEASRFLFFFCVWSTHLDDNTGKVTTSNHEHGPLSAIFTSVLHAFELV